MVATKYHTQNLSARIIKIIKNFFQNPQNYIKYNFMKILYTTIPYPPSVNRIYHNRIINKDSCTKNHLRGRGLTKEAKDYKQCVAKIFYYSFFHSKFEDQNVKVTILDNPAHRRGDSHNGLKIVFDAMQLSGIINNDKQIVAHEVIPGAIKNPPVWRIKIEPYTLTMKETEL